MDCICHFPQLYANCPKNCITTCIQISEWIICNFISSPWGELHKSSINYVKINTISTTTEDSSDMVDLH